MPFSVVTPPAFEPVSNAMATLHARAIAADTTLIDQFIRDARALAENYTQRVFPQRTMRWTSPGFYPMAGDWRWNVDRWAYASPWESEYARAKLSEGLGWRTPQIELLAPVSSVSSVRYYDSTNTQQTLATSAYSVETVCEPAVLRFTPGVTLPTVFDRADAVSVDFVAGYPDVESMPAGLVTWMLAKISTWYGQRESIETGGRLVETSRNYVDVALDGLVVATRFG